MILYLTIILLEVACSIPITTNVIESTTQSVHLISNNTTEQSLQTNTEIKIERIDTEINDNHSNISRIDYIKEVPPPKLSIPLVKSNGTTYGDTFSNPYGTKLDLPSPEELSNHPDFKGYDKEMSEFPILLQEYFRSKQSEKQTQEDKDEYIHIPKLQTKNKPSSQIIKEVHGQPDIIYKNPKDSDYQLKNPYKNQNENTKLIPNHNDNRFLLKEMLRLTESSRFSNQNVGYPSKGPPQNEYSFKPSVEENEYDNFKPIKSPDFYEDSKKDDIQIEYGIPEEQEVIKKHIYVHVPPKESSETEQDLNPPIIKKEKHYRIIFIKTPSSRVVAPIPKTLIQKQEKTLIYVLVKKPDVPKLFRPQIASDSNTATKPEVYYIKYGTNKGYVDTRSISENPVNEDIYLNERKDLEDLNEKSSLDDVTVV